MRIKKSRFCDATVRSVSSTRFRTANALTPACSAYTGYIDVEARHLFFYFFESRRDPAKDDVVFWTNGGPGGSSAVGLFMELGPCRVTSPNETAYHPYSWNEYSNIFFIDQPVGTGFSYADHREYVVSCHSSLKRKQDSDPSRTLRKKPPRILLRSSRYSLNISASSRDEDSTWLGSPTAYVSGRYLRVLGSTMLKCRQGRSIPVFASHIYDQNARLAAAGLSPVNLSSIMLGECAYHGSGPCADSIYGPQETVALRMRPCCRHIMT